MLRPRTGALRLVRLAPMRYGGFFDNLSAAELARRQGVKPAARVEDLYGHGDPADWEGFDEALAQWRAARAGAFDRF